MAKRKPYAQMSTAELAAATAEYDREWTGCGLPGKPLTAAQRALHRRAKRRGRPTVGKGAKRVLITVERSLLAEADAYAKKHKMNRSQLIAASLRRTMSPKAA